MVLPSRLLLSNYVLLCALVHQLQILRPCRCGVCMHVICIIKQPGARLRTFELLAIKPLHGGGGGERVLVGDCAVTFQLTSGLVLVQPHLQGKVSHIEIQWLERR